MYDRIFQIKYEDGSTKWFVWSVTDWPLGPYDTEEDALDAAEFYWG